MDRRGFDLYINGEQAKKRWVVEKDGLIFDLPRTIYNLAESPRFSRLVKHLDDVENVDEGKKIEIKAGARAELVKAFFSGLQKAKNSDPNASREKMEIVDIKNIKDLVSG